MLKRSLFIAGVLLGNNAFADTITLAADPWCPYTCDSKSDKPGMLIELAKAIFESKGHTVVYTEVNWSRAIEETRKGTYIGLVGAGESDAPDFIYTKGGMLDSEICFFVKKDGKWKYDGLKSLDAVSVATIQDYAYDGGEIDAYIKKNVTNAKKINPISGDAPLERNLQKLLAGRVDSVIEYKNVALYNLEKIGKKTDIKESGCLAPTNIGIAFSPKNPKSKEYAKLIEEGMIALKKTDKLKKIMSKYGINN